MKEEIEKILGYKTERTYLKSIGGFKKKVTAKTNYDSRVDKLLSLFKTQMEGIAKASKPRKFIPAQNAEPEAYPMADGYNLALHDFESNLLEALKKVGE